MNMIVYFLVYIHVHMNATHPTDAFRCMFVFTGEG